MGMCQHAEWNEAAEGYRVCGKPATLTIGIESKSGVRWYVRSCSEHSLNRKED